MNRICSRTRLHRIFISLSFTLTATFSTSAQVPTAEHVVLIGIDGLCPAGIRTVDPPNFRKLVSEGASTMHARSVMPTSSSPNWASMIMGAGPEQHGITSNDWQPDKFDISPVATGSGGIFPTIFGVIREQKKGASIACVHDWDGFGRLIEPKVPDLLENVKG